MDWLLQFVSYLLNPVLLAFATGLVLLWRRASNCGRLVRVLAWSFATTLWLLGCRPVVELLFRPLEAGSASATVESLKERRVREIVVPTGGGYDTQGEILSASLPHASLYRLVAGLELAAGLGPECRVVFSGSAGRGNRDVKTAETMAQIAGRLSPGLRVLAEAESGSTEEHGRNVRLLVGGQPFALVTSAYHMPRAIRALQAAGLAPIPFAADSYVRGDYSAADWLPSTQNYWNLDVALREYEARVFAWIRHQVRSY